MGCTLEMVAKNGDAMLDFTAGRVVNPGHDIECAWFLLDEAIYRNDNDLKALANMAPKTKTANKIISDDQILADFVSLFN